MNSNELSDLILEKSKGKQRFIVAVAGPPASGKSTVAEKLAQNISAKCKKSNPVIVAMDGFHLDNERLDELGLRARKGAVNTFDGDGFVALIEAIYRGDDVVEIPAFDRALDKVVNLGQTISADNDIIIVEGNYLLVEETPWRQLLAMFDMPIFLLPKTSVLEERLIQRWLANGHCLDAAKARAYSNDIPNAKYVLANSAYVDHTYERIDL